MIEHSDAQDKFDASARGPSGPSQPKSAAEWGPYRAFLAVATSTTLEVAALSIGVSLATLRRRVERLEDELQTKLYTTKNGLLQLTDAGHGIAKKIARADEVLEAIISLRQPKKALSRIPLRFCTNAAFLNNVMFEWMQEEPEIFDRYRINFLGSNSRESRTGFRVHIQIMASPSDSNNTLSFPIGSARYAFCVTDNYIRRFGRPSPENLENHRIVTPQRAVIFGSYWYDLVALEKQCGNCIRVDDYLETQMVVESGLAMGIISHTGLHDGLEVLDCFPTFNSRLFLNFDREFFGRKENKALVEFIQRKCLSIFSDPQ